MQTILKGGGANVPILIGTNLEELRYWTAIENLPLDKRPPDVLRKQLEPLLGASASAVIDIYRKSNLEQGQAIVALLGDLMFRIPSIRFAEANSTRQPTWMYLFTYRSTAPGNKYGAAHAMELPFVFGVLDRQDVIDFTGKEEHRETLMNQIQQAWTSFARTGNPNHPSLPSWPKYDTKTRATMELGIPSRVVNDPYANERKAWASVPFDGVTPSIDQASGLMTLGGGESTGGGEEGVRRGGIRTGGASQAGRPEDVVAHRIEGSEVGRSNDRVALHGEPNFWIGSGNTYDASLAD